MAGGDCPAGSTGEEEESNTRSTPEHGDYF